MDNAQHLNSGIMSELQSGLSLAFQELSELDITMSGTVTVQQQASQEDRSLSQRVADLIGDFDALFSISDEEIEALGHPMSADEALRLRLEVLQTDEQNAAFEALETSAPPVNDDPFASLDEDPDIAALAFRLDALNDFAGSSAELDQDTVEFMSKDEYISDYSAFDVEMLLKAGVAGIDIFGNELIGTPKETYTPDVDFDLPTVQDSSNPDAPPVTVTPGLMEDYLKVLVTDPMFKDNVEAFHPALGTRLKRRMKKKSTYASLVPGVAIAKGIKKVRHEHRKKTAMKNLAQDAQSDLVHGSASTTQGRAKMKRNVAVVGTTVAVASSATSIATGGISSVVGGAVGGAGGTALGMVTSSVTSATVREGSKLAAQQALKAHDKKNPNQSHIMGKQVTGTSGKRKGDLNHYKNQRALLYSLGQGLQTDQQLSGTHRDAYLERARLEIKRDYGCDPDTDLCSREKVDGDWLTADERETYQLLKAGKITSAQVPRTHRLPLLWEANKLFDFHAQQLKEAAAAEKKALKRAASQ